MKIARIIFFVLLLFGKSNAQNIDSLVLVVDKMKEDTLKLNALAYLSDNLPTNAWVAYNEKALELSIKLLDSNNPFVVKRALVAKMDALNNKGYMLTDNRKTKESIPPFLEAMKIGHKIRDDRRLASVYNNFAYSLYQLGKFGYAIYFNNLSLKKKEIAGDSLAIYTSLNNIASIYNEQADYTNSLFYYQKSLKVLERVDDPDAKYVVNLNIGNSYIQTGHFLQGKPYIENAIKYAKETNKIDRLFRARLNEGIILRETKNNEAAEKIFEEISISKYAKKDKSFEAQLLIQQALLKSSEGKHKEALDLALRSCALVENLHVRAYRLFIISKTAELANDAGDYKTAVKYLFKSNQLQKQLTDFQTRQNILKQSLEYEFVKKESELKLKAHEQKALAEVEIKKKQLVYFLALFIIILAITFIFYVINRYKILSAKNRIIEEKNTLIGDSIGYATNIQFAMFPQTQKLKKMFNDFLIAIQPKDKVSGDFYWAFEYEDGRILAVTADCTGHGVPGAFMSVLGMSILEKIVGEQHLSNPAEILFRLNNEIYQSLSRGGTSKVTDGMDIAILCIDSKNHLALFSASMNNLYFVENNSVSEIKGDVVSLGKIPLSKNPYSNKEIKFGKDTAFYMFTDGYCDQKGGPNNKKFYPQYLREKLLSIQNVNMREQKEVLTRSFNEWKGSNEQVDDVLVFGIKPKLF